MNDDPFNFRFPPVPEGQPDPFEKAKEVQAKLQEIHRQVKAGNLDPFTAAKESLELMQGLVGKGAGGAALDIDITVPFRAVLFALGEEETAKQIIGVRVGGAGPHHAALMLACKPGFDIDGFIGEGADVTNEVPYKAMKAALASMGLNVTRDESGVLVIEQFLDEHGHTCTDPSHDHAGGRDKHIDSEVANFMAGFEKTFGPAVGGRPLPPPTWDSLPPPGSQPSDPGWNDKWMPRKS